MVSPVRVRGEQWDCEMDTGTNRRKAAYLAPGDTVQWSGMDALVTDITCRHGRVSLTLMGPNAKVYRKTVDERTQMVVR